VIFIAFLEAIIVDSIAIRTPKRPITVGSVSFTAFFEAITVGFIAIKETQKGLSPRVA
jgi:hypothetical protein